MNIFKDVLDFWAITWKEDKFLFFSEAIGTFLGMAAASILNIQSTEPNMLVVLSLYFISAILLGIASYKRKASFMLLLMAFYGTTSIYGITNLFIGV